MLVEAMGAPSFGPAERMFATDLHVCRAVPLSRAGNSDAVRNRARVRSSQRRATGCLLVA
jgi:hypothetical protein